MFLYKDTFLLYYREIMPKKYLINLFVFNVENFSNSSTITIS